MAGLGLPLGGASGEGPDGAQPNSSQATFSRQGLREPFHVCGPGTIKEKNAFFFLSEKWNKNDSFFLIPPWNTWTEMGAGQRWGTNTGMGYRDRDMGVQERKGEWGRKDL